MAIRLRWTTFGIISYAARSSESCTKVAFVSRRRNKRSGRYGTPEIFTQGAQFTSEEFTHVLSDRGIDISLDGKGRWIDNVFEPMAIHLTRCPTFRGHI
jgi:hypothetical protein